MSEMKSALNNGSCHMKTIVNSITYTFNWTVENFSKFPLGREQKSPTFHPLTNKAFYATLKLNLDSNSFFNFHHIYSGTPIEVNHQVSIENKTGQVVLECVKLYTYTNCSYCDFQRISSAIMKKAREEDVLIFKCVMELYKKVETDIYYDKLPSFPVSLLDDLSALSNDLKAIYDKTLNTDVSLKVGDNIVRAHKLILCARSSVFARMFETPMDEREDNLINITDVDPPVLKDLVSYLYTDVLAKDDLESVCALYYAADKYDVPSLRKKCAAVLLSKLDVRNACRVLALADRHSDAEFKNPVMNFTKFYFDKILETDAWGELVKNTPRLATEVISAFGENRKRKREH